MSAISNAGRQEKPKRLAFVADRRGWAFDNIARNIGELLAPEYDVSRFYAVEYPERENLLYHLFVENRFDNVHFIGREIYFQQLSKLSRLARLARKRGMNLPSLASSMADTVTTASVYDHLQLDEAAVAERQQKFALLDAYATSSQRLFREYGKRYRRPPACVTPDGVDLGHFKPQDLGRFDRHDRPLVVGWAGNSLWPRIDGRRRSADPADDRKGLHTLVVPAIESLRAEGLGVLGSFADRNVEWRPHDAMPQYYAAIDVLVCASESEGTPNPVLEAMACGVPVLSTDVGIVPEAFGPEQAKYTIPERTTEAVAHLIRQLHDDRSRLRILSRENLHSIRAWTWECQVPKWHALFQEAEANHAAHRSRKMQTLGWLGETGWKKRLRWLSHDSLERRLTRNSAIGL